MAKRFRFRLQKLLKHRIALERQAQIELVQRRMQLAQEQEALAQLHAREQRLVDMMTPARGERIDIEKRVQCQHAIQRLQQQQDAQQQKIEAAERAVHEQTQVVAQAGKDVKVLEKLREKQKEAFRAEELRAEQIFLDDIAGQQYTRKQIAGEVT